MVFIIFLLILYLAYCLHKIYKYERQSKLCYLVAWSVTTNYQDTKSLRPGLDLIDYIYRAQRNLEIPTEYCFTKQSELDVVDLILKEYQRSLAQRFFNYTLLPPNNKKRISGEQYFMYMLCKMLNEHQCDSNYLNHDMHGKRLYYTEYGSWGGKNYDAVYSLTDFALTYHKLYYITYLFCKNDPTISQTGNFLDSDCIKKTIDAKQISICRYS